MFMLMYVYTFDGIIFFANLIDCSSSKANENGKGALGEFNDKKEYTDIIKVSSCAFKSVPGELEVGRSRS